MVNTFVSALRLPISNARLEAYRQPGVTDFEIVTNYFWNIALSTALYPLLQAFEVSLRNSIHAAASNHYKTPLWFDQQDVLLPKQRKKVREARGELKNLGNAQTPDDIVAILNLGFWVSLFNSRYELPLPPAAANQLTWHDAQSRPSSLFLATFPHAPNRVQSRQKIADRCNTVLSLRNRVMRHEPVWKNQTLSQQHDEMLELIGWISPTMRAVTTIEDIFAMVYAGGRDGIRSRLRGCLEMP